MLKNKTPRATVTERATRLAKKSVTLGKALQQERKRVSQILRRATMEDLIEGVLYI